MSPDKDAELRRLYPLVYGAGFLNGEPFRCGDGWYPLLSDLGRELTAIIAETPENERDRLRACQVKEKFGGLRVYFYGTETVAMADAVREAEEVAARTCETCGEPGTLRSGGWIKTLCDAHQAEWQAWKRGPTP